MGTKTQERPLTAKQAAFVREYLVDHNGAQAAIRAGYSPRRAENQASYLLAIRKVASAVAAGQAALAKRTEITAERLLNEVWAMAHEEGATRLERSKCYDMTAKLIGAYSAQRVDLSGNLAVKAEVTVGSAEHDAALAEIAVQSDAIEDAEERAAYVVAAIRAL